ncbi:MAG: type II CAAX prenyl endopeptidase Rce1 family protein [Acidobacteriota bacterium]
MPLDAHGRTELALVLALGGGNLVAEAAHAKTPFVLAGAVICLAWVALRIRGEPGVLRSWGFRTDTLVPALRPVGIATASILAAIAVWAAAAQRLPPPPGFWPTLVLYPLWGIAQQFLLNAVLARRLREALPEWAAWTLATALFSLAHAPDVPLMLLAGAAGALWIPIYRRWPNLWLLGFCHGVLGSAVWYGVLGRDAWLALSGGGAP